MIKNTNINNINIVTDAGYIIIVVGQQQRMFNI